MSKSSTQIVSAATAAQRRQAVMALRAAVSAQVLLWNQQKALGAAVQQLMRLSELHDEQDAAACSLVVDMAVGWDGQILKREDLETLVERVLKSTGGV